MSTIRIVEYERKYAAELAKMWNMSADSWGGFESLETEESVVQENEGSENLKTWLALDGDEVVGYCTFSEYREDQGASYIPLLNVRPDYHSKKVGKALVLKAVEQACQCPWPRLDLYTWPGNTKAVPLYKKCGFFWENRDDSTHLMNFIPYVMQTEAAADFFREADWYADSVREIKVEPDGRKENEFDYFGYHWQHGQRTLRMEFERRSRGLRLIETEDWLVEASVEDLNLAFGRTYTVRYRLVNKTGKPLEVVLKGKDDKNIAFNLERTVTVGDETVVAAEFHVNEISEEQNVWRTHPGVCAELLINGKKALFKVGIVPKFPALVKAVVPENECYAGSRGELYLNMENGFKEPATFTFTLPRADFIDMEQHEFEVRMEPGEKKAVPVPYTPKALGLWSAEVKISARPQSGGVIQYQRQLAAVFAGPGAGFGGESDDRWFAVNGRYMLALQKFNNVLEASPLEKEPYYSYFMRPQVGLPYSVEFAKTRPVHVEQGVDKGVAYIRARYLPQPHPGLEIERRVFLQADGLAWQSWGLKNTGGKSIDNLWFRSMVRQSLRGAVVPLKGRIIEARDGYGEFINNFPVSELSENWIFSKAGIGRGLCWPREIKPISANGMFCFDHEVGSLKPGEEKELKPIFLSMGTFRRWQEFRKYALKLAETDADGTDSLEVLINGGNPFVDKDYALTVREHKNVPCTGDVTAASQQGTFADKVAPISDNKALLVLPAPARSSVDQVRVEVNTEVVLRRQTAVFGVGGEVTSVHRQQAGQDILTTDNGAVRFSAAQDFGPVLYSLEYQGREWLDSSFPEARPKSWWNPWLGGSGLDIQGLSKRSMLREPRSVRFVSARDNVGNEWQGIQIQVTVTEHEKFKGLKLNHNILTLPGLTGICMYFEIEHSGLAIENVECINEVFLAPGGAVAGSWAEAAIRPGEVIRYKQGGGQSARVKKLVYGSDTCPDRLLTFSTTDTDVYTTKEVMLFGSFEKFNLIPGKSLTTRPQFFLFTREDIPQAALEALTKIRF